MLYIYCVTLCSNFSSSGTRHPVELEVHERVNYLNNKAEKGEHWSDHNKPKEGEHQNLVPPTDNDDSISDTQDGNRNSNQSDGGISDLFVRRKDSISRNVASNCSEIDGRPSYPTIPLPPVPVGVHAQSNKDSVSDPVYANHQFEKVAQRQRAKSGADNCAYQVDVDFNKNKPLIEVPTKPVPAPRKQKMVASSNH